MTAAVVAAAATMLATEGGDVSPGVVGFVVIALLAAATYLLIRSMNRRIRRIDLPEDQAAEQRDDDEGRQRQ